MPATLPMLYASAKRLPRKQHIDQSDVNFGGDILKQVVPYKGMNIVTFSFTVPGLTEFVTTRSGRKIGPIPHNEIIAFMDCEILQQSEVPENEGDYFHVNYKGDSYWIKKIDANRQKALVRCDCFTGDTKVIMGDGSYETLENLVGLTNKKVISYNSESGKYEVANMLKCEKKSDDSKIVAITLDNGQIIKSTLDHLFLTKNDGWVKALDLKEGQSLQALYGYVDGEKLYQSNPYKTDKDRNWLRIRNFVSNEDYYVYIYLDTRKPGNYTYGGFSFSYEPIYVGKGRGSRCNEHLNNCNNPNIPDTLFYRKLRSMLSENAEPVIMKHCCGLTETAAFELESKLIETIGRLNLGDGPLTNLTNGGEGGSGLQQTMRVKERMRNNNPMQNPEVVEKQQRTARDRHIHEVKSKDMKINNPMFDKDTVAKTMKSNKENGRYDSENMKKIAHARTTETFKQIIKSREFNNPDCYKKFAEGGIAWRAKAIADGTYHAFTDEFKQKASQSSKNNWQNTEIREKMLAGFRQRNKSKEYHEKIQKSKIVKGMVEVLKKYGEFIPEYYVTPGGRMKLENVKKRGWYDELLQKAKQEAFYNHKVVSIKVLENQPVYCMTVEGLGNFTIATPDEDSNLISGVTVKNCSDFFYTWAYADFKTGNIWGRPPKKYIRKTPPPPKGRPYRNPRNVPGYCKHIFYIWRNYMQPRRHPDMFI